MDGNVASFTVQLTLTLQILSTCTGRIPPVQAHDMFKVHILATALLTLTKLVTGITFIILKVAADKLSNITIPLSGRFSKALSG